MPSFGENLRREREMRGVTLEEISAATKISLRFLKALEAEDFSSLPSGIFTRSFVRAYTKHLGLDEEPFLAEYQLAARPAAEMDLNRWAASKPVGQRGGSRAALLAILVAVSMLGGSYFLYRRSRPAAENQSNSGTPATTPPTASQAAEPAPPEPTAPAPSDAAAAQTAAGTTVPQNSTDRAASSGTRPEPGPSTAKTAAADADLILQVAATEQAWVAVSADGKTTFQRILNPREFKTLRAKHFFDVVTGNAQGIVLTLNGETLNPLGGRNAYKKVHLTRDDIKNPAP